MSNANTPGKISLPPAPTPREIFNNASYDSPVSTRSQSRPAGSGGNVDLNDEANDGSLPLPKPRRRSTRQSFAASFRRNGPAGFGGNNGNRRVSAWSGVETIVDESMKLPSLVPGIRPAYMTPLPRLPMLVLCIVSSLLHLSSHLPPRDSKLMRNQAMLSELLSANLCTPFLLKMVEGVSTISFDRRRTTDTSSSCRVLPLVRSRKEQ